MNKIFVKICVVLGFVLFFQACSSKNSNSLKSIAQTNSASSIEIYKNEVFNLLLKYKNKLNLRNPYLYNKDISSEIAHQILMKKNYINIVQNGKKLNSYKQYLHYAFSKKNIKNRNDFLILGMYKLMYKAFDIKGGHKFAAGQYNKEEMIKLYEYLQIIRWKIRTNKDEKGFYLFKTWQNNWQLELSKKSYGDLNIIKKLKYIEEKKESIFDHSNFSFEVILSSMLVNIEHILRKINVEPYELGISVLTSFVFVI